ncbi:MAG TPA: SH3 domain-containing protein [Herpetosiphonaceae bacterium]
MTDMPPETSRTVPADQEFEAFFARASKHGAPTKRNGLPGPDVRQRLNGLRHKLPHLPHRYALHLLLVTLMGSSLAAGQLHLQGPATDFPAPTPIVASTFEIRPFSGIQAEPGTPVPAAGGIALSPDLRFSSRSDGLMPAFQPFGTRISGDTANLRSGPGTAFDKAGQLDQGAEIKVLARRDSWLQIETADQATGWVAADLVSLPEGGFELIPEAENVPLPPPALIASTTADNLNLRDGPGTDYVGMTKLDANIEVDLLARAGEWFQVQTSDGASGWLIGEFLAIQPGVIERVPETADIPSANPTLVGSVSETGVNLRGGPDKGFESLGKLTADTELKLLARYKEWLKVETPRGTTGWIAADYVQASAYITRRVPATSNVPSLPKAAAPPAAAAGGSRWVWPAAGSMTSTFGWRTLGRTRNFHDGIDIANGRGTRIVAIRGGTVTKAGWCSGYGYCVMIDHGGGLSSEYGHMMSAPPVSAGQQVAAGQLIGYMGSTYDAAGGGYSTGVHVHLTVRRNGSAVNPLNYLP